MIGFATPWVFGVAVAAALAITALHLLSVRQPRVMRLPTARFVPERDARAVARQAKPSDVRLLLLRVIALLAAGSALAGARCGAAGASVSSLLVIDATLRADSAALVARAVTATAVADAAPLTVLWVKEVTNDPGVAITAAIREAARQAQSSPALNELSLAVVLPGYVRSRAGWDAWRSQWPANIRVISSVLATAVDTSTVLSATPRLVRLVETRAARGVDVVEAAFASRGVLIARDSVRDRAQVVVQWPVSGVPAGWQQAPPLDSIGAITAAGIALVAPWVRTALPPLLSDSVRAIAWWSDGVAMAVERPRGTSCVREVALVVPDASDLLLSPAADGLLRALRAPCGGRTVPAPRENARSNGNGFALASRFREAGTTSRATRPAWLGTALLALALLALLVEQIVRRDSTRRRPGVTAP